MQAMSFSVASLIIMVSSMITVYCWKIFGAILPGSFSSPVGNKEIVGVSYLVFGYPATWYPIHAGT